jgi:tetratricopeptide (TPR) repeat protein
MNKDELDKAQELIHKSIELNPLSEANINLGNILRQLGRRSEAIDHAWQGIESLCSPGEFDRPVQLDASTYIVPETPGPIHVVSVKWGKKYGADYVNKLYRGVLKFLTEVEFDFYCFTEDPSGLEEGIKVIPLAENWTGWWGKATLFSDTGLEGRLLYIDLDSVITGELNELARYQGAFAVMGTSDLECEKAKDGYNTSIISWHSGFGKEIYSVLKKYYKQTLKFICRFDFWTEMMVKNAGLVQDLFPGMFLDYLTYCKDHVPEGCRMVCFPREPKPHDYKSDWIRELWV